MTAYISSPDGLKVIPPIKLDSIQTAFNYPPDNIEGNLLQSLTEKAQRLITRRTKKLRSVERQIPLVEKEIYALEIQEATHQTAIGSLRDHEESQSAYRNRAQRQFHISFLQKMRAKKLAEQNVDGDQETQAADTHQTVFNDASKPKTSSISLGAAFALTLNAKRKTTAARIQRNIALPELTTQLSDTQETLENKRKALHGLQSTKRHHIKRLGEQTKNLVGLQHSIWLRQREQETELTSHDRFATLPPELI